jgi:CHAT domain-containing protein
VLRRRTGDTRGEAADLNNLGLVSQALGDTVEAARAFETALDLNRRAGRSGQAATNLTNLANLATLGGDYARAAALYADALGIYRESGDRVEAAFVLHDLGLLATRRGDYPLARAALAEAVAIDEEAGHTADAVAARRALATAAAAMGDLQGALIEVRRAEQRVGGAPGSLGIRARLALSHADLAVQLNTLAEAELQYARSERLFRAAGDPAGRAEAQQGRATLSILRENYGAAEALLALAERTQRAFGDRRGAAQTRLLMAHAQAQRGDTTAARRSYANAEGDFAGLADSVGHAATLGGRADLEGEAGRPFAAESLYHRALDYLGDRPAPGVRWPLLAGLGGALESRGARPAALRAYQDAVTEIERVSGTLRLGERRASFLADKWDVYASLAMVKRTQGDVTGAFEVSERLRARQLLDLLARGRIAGATPAAEAGSAREQDVRRRIEELTQRLEGGAEETGTRGPEAPSREQRVVREALAEAQQAYASLLLDLRESDPRYTRLVVADVVPLREVAAHLAPRQALLEYLVTDSTSLVFVVTRDTIAALDLNVGRRSLAPLVEFVRGTMTGPSRALPGVDWRAPLRRLAQLLIEPVEASGLLTGKDELLISPHAELHYLPFDALLRAGSPERFLAERYAVSYVPSASVWVRLGERPVAAGPITVLALAPRAGPLPGSREEVEAIRTVYGSRATVLVGNEASEPGFRAAASGYGILHLATYGVLNKHNPMFSFVELAPAGAEDGRLEVREVFDLSLNARLVVLSACQTALGSGALADVPAGDDWVGLARAFLAAGSRSVVATLWPVGDRGTARLMEQFYRRLEAGATALEALTEAKRSALRDPELAHPFFWAGFALVGAS